MVDKVKLYGFDNQIIMKLKLKWWWYIIPIYLTLWTLAFSLWNFVDGQGMMKAFGVATGGASEFIMLNSAARYLAIGVAMVAGIWFFRTYQTILLALLVRLVMDLLDLYAGLKVGLITNATGVIQSLIMFIIPGLIAIYTLYRHHNTNKTS
ncbi:MAG TPA: hypothetical protein DCS93_25170 [Microscillaceae bacterium]|nr:hypothetical protein [Microscillaceae bacterium]